MLLQFRLLPHIITVKHLFILKWLLLFFVISFVLNEPFSSQSLLINERIKEYENLRCTNYAKDKSKFIASALSRSRRAIILDRAMIKNSDNDDFSLVTDPIKVKSAAIQHFQTIAGVPPPSTISDINDMSDRWRS